MKIEQKGLSTTVIVGIVVAVVFVVVVGGVAAVILLKPGAGGGVGNLPVYGGATKVDTGAGVGTGDNFLSGIISQVQNLPSGVQAEIYTATGSVDEILNYYRTEMANAEWVEPWWTGQYDNSGSMSFGSISATVGVLCFEKGDEGVEVFALSYTY